MPSKASGGHTPSSRELFMHLVTPISELATSLFLLFPQPLIVLLAFPAAPRAHNLLDKARPLASSRINIDTWYSATSRSQPTKPPQAQIRERDNTDTTLATTSAATPLSDLSSHFISNLTPARNRPINNKRRSTALLGQPTPTPTHKVPTNTNTALL